MINIHKIKQNYSFIDNIKIGIDRIKLNIPLVKLNESILDTLNKEEVIHLYKIYKSEFFVLMKYIRSLLSDMKCLKKIKGGEHPNLHTYQLLTDETKELVATFSVGMIYGNHFISFSFNPSKWTFEHKNQFDIFMQLALSDNYLELYRDSDVSHIEFFIDIPDCSINDLVLLDTGKRQHSLYKGTTYYGKRNSDLVGTMYDKGLEQKTLEKRVRIEIRLNNTAVTFAQLIEQSIPNPFNSFIVVPQEALNEVAAYYPTTPNLAKDIKEKGLNGSISNKHAKKIIIQKLKEKTISWWDVEEIWNHFKKILTVFKPKQHYLKNCAVEAYRIFRHPDILERVLKKELEII